MLLSRACGLFIKIKLNKVTLLLGFLNNEQLDRFIPNRSAMDFDYAHYMVTEGRKRKENSAPSSPSSEAYQKLLAEALNMDRTRILAFRNKPPKPVKLFPDHHSPHTSELKKARRHIPQVSDIGITLTLIFIRYSSIQ